MLSILRLRQLLYLETATCSLPLESKKVHKKTEGFTSTIESSVDEQQQPRKTIKRRKPGKWRAGVDNCCWTIGYICTTWWFVLFLYNNVFPAALLGFQVPESPGARLRREGLTAVHPVLLVPGIVTGGLELWEGHPCAEDLFRKRLWSGSFTDILKRRPLCWLEHLSLHNDTGLDPSGIRVRAVPGLVAPDSSAAGHSIWAILIENLAKIGYEGKNLYMAAYDWRLSFQNTEIRDQSLSRLKKKIELMFETNGNTKVVVVPHSMGALYFLHFLKWVESPPPMDGGGGGPGWCAKHIKAVMNIGPAFLGIPKAVRNVLSAEGKDVAFHRSMASDILDYNVLGHQTLSHVMRVSRTWDSIMSLMPKGGETIWGNLSWSPLENCGCDLAKNKCLQPGHHNVTNRDGKRNLQIQHGKNYGKIISFTKLASQLPFSELQNSDLKELVLQRNSTELSSLCGDILTEYDEMDGEDIKEVVNFNAYTAKTMFDLLHFVAPKMMHRAEAHFSHEIAENLDDPEYARYKHWSNPLAIKLPDAPDMEIYCLYGVGIPTEISYMYKMSATDKCNSIPFQIDSSVTGNEGSCLKGGVYYADGDGSVPVVSAGFMCAKGWRGKTRFNPSGAPTYIREFKHKTPANLLEERGEGSGTHVDITGNVALIEDIIRVAAGAPGQEIGGDKIYSDIFTVSEKVDLRP